MVLALDPFVFRLERSGNGIVEFHYDVSLSVGIVLDKTGVFENGKTSNCKTEKDRTQKTRSTRCMRGGGLVLSIVAF